MTDPTPAAPVDPRAVQPETGIVEQPRATLLCAWLTAFVSALALGAAVLTVTGPPVSAATPVSATTSGSPTAADVLRDTSVAARPSSYPTFERSLAAGPLPKPPPPPAPVPPPTAPLTGLVVAADDPLLARPVLALKIDNAPRARPQDGLERADIVITELVEGGTTRFIALYHSQAAGIVGPVRSGRDLDALILPAFHPVLGMSGAATPTLATLDAAGLLSFHEDRNPGAFVRRSDRRAPHNFFADTARLWAATPALPAATPAWPFAEPIPAGGAPVSALTLRHSPYEEVAWAWDPLTGLWRRTLNGAPHLAASGAHLGARNVVLARVPIIEGRGVDVTGARTRDAMVIGEGEAVVLRDGQAFTARWRKTAPDAHFQWLTADGAPLPLGPGTTWVELQDTTQPYSLR